MGKKVNKTGGISSLKYLKNNRKRTLVLVLSLGFFITMLYGISYLFSTTTSSAYSAVADSKKRIQLVIPESNLLDLNTSVFNDSNTTNEERMAEYYRGLNKMADQFKAHAEIEDAFPCSAFSIELNTIIGQLFYYTVLVEADKVASIVDYNGAILVEGTLPINPGEIVIDSTMAQNLKVSVGDHITNLDLTLTGIVKSDSYFACAVNNNVHWNPGLVFLSDGKVNDYQNLCSELGYPLNQVWIYDYINGKHDVVVDVYNILNFSKNLITIISTILLSLCIIVVFQMYIHDRHEEWCLYHSIGFSTKDVYLLANRELLLCFTLSIVFATVSGTTLVLALKKYLIDPMGVMSTPLMPSEFINILSILVIIFGLLQIPISYSMHRIKTVDAISEEAM